MIYGKMPEGTTFYAVKGLNVNTAATAQIQDGEEQVTILEGLKRHAFKRFMSCWGGQRARLGFQIRLSPATAACSTGSGKPSRTRSLRAVHPACEQGKSDGSSVYTNSRISFTTA